MHRIYFILTIVAYTTWANPIQFRTDQLIISLPNMISASGNTVFNDSTTTINATHVSYNLQNNQAFFNEGVHLHTKKSTLTGDQFRVQYDQKQITGSGNITVLTPEIHAQSNQLQVDDFKILTLKNNVVAKQNGSQINSNELIYNLDNDTIISDQRIKITIKE